MHTCRGLRRPCWLHGPMSATYAHVRRAVSSAKLAEAMRFRRLTTYGDLGRLRLRHDQVLEHEKGTSHAHATLMPCRPQGHA